MVREFLSKAIAGGLSAGLVLLWWPVLFEDVDTVTSWFVRGVAWTVCFEVLLLALKPFERAVWETAHGRRITRRVGAAGSRLYSGSPRRRMGRLSAIATVALAVPVALLVMGLEERGPARAEASPVLPIKVVRVTKVVRPVTVNRVIERAPSAGRPIVTTPAPQQEAATPAAAPKGSTPSREAIVRHAAPPQRDSAPEPQLEEAPHPVEGCDGEACGS